MRTANFCNRRRNRFLVKVTFHALDVKHPLVLYAIPGTMVNDAIRELLACCNWFAPVKKRFYYKQLKAVQENRAVVEMCVVREHTKIALVVENHLLHEPFHIYVREV
jgi:hypothetical protein